MEAKHSSNKIDKHGFTLLELVVVMAIVAVLVFLGIVGILQLQRSSRDQERRVALADINKEIQNYRRLFLKAPATDTLILSESAEAFFISDISTEEPEVELEKHLKPANMSNRTGTLYYIGVDGTDVVLCVELESGSIYQLDDGVDGDNAADCPSDTSSWPSPQ